MDAKKTTSRKRFFRFGLRTFLIVTTVICVWFGIVKTEASKQSDVVKLVQATGGYCRYDFEVDEKGKLCSGGKSRVPEVLLNLLGVDFFHDVVEVQLYHSNSSQYGYFADGGSIRMIDNEARLPGSDAVAAACGTIDQLLTLESLRTISLPALKDLDSIFESRLSKLEQLERITILRGGDLTDQGIASIKDLKNLKSISIEQTKIGDPSLAVIGEMKSMEFLYLGGHAFSDEGIAHLTGLDELTFLCVDGPPEKVKSVLFSFFNSSDEADEKSGITDQGLQQLLGLNKLTFLSAGRTQSTNEVVAKFKSANPSCTVIR